MLKYFLASFFCISLIFYTSASEEDNPLASEEDYISASEEDYISASEEDNADTIRYEFSKFPREMSVSRDDIETNKLLILSLMDNLSEHDTVGSLAEMADKLASLAAKNILKPNVMTCSTTEINIGSIKMYHSLLPKGDCPICCHPNRPNDFVNLYVSPDSACRTLQILEYQKPGSLAKAGIDPNLRTIFIAHGFTEGLPLSYHRNICSAYKSRRENYNIIYVDWKEASAAPWYEQAAKNTQYVAMIVANFIKFYQNTQELQLENIHLIGFSLGAHVVGGIAKQFLYRRIPRVTGLDPAFPSFPFAEKFYRLDKDDALFVDIIHTDGGWFGYPVSLGHIDFYPNNGKSPQPGCWLISDRCSHARSTDLYADSVQNPEAFKIVNGNKYSYMGFKAIESNTRGDIYCTTNARSPFRVLK